MSLRWHTVVIDCADVDAQGSWWGMVLGWRRLHTDGNHVVIVPPWVIDDHGSINPETRGPGMIFVPTGEPKQTKNRLHFDLAPSTGSNQRTEVDRLLRLGATRVAVGQGDEVAWVVLADPEGNEFCVLPDGTP
jgi:hypothetical protein